MLKPIVRKISRKDEDLGYDIEAVKYKKYFENTTFRLKRKSWSSYIRLKKKV